MHDLNAMTYYYLQISELSSNMKPKKRLKITGAGTGVQQGPAGNRKRHIWI